MEKRSIKIDLETAKQMYKSIDPNIQKLALAAYPELKEPKYPTWDNMKPIKGYYIDLDSNIKDYCSRNKEFNNNNKNVWPTKELAEAALTLSQLLQLRDAYNKMEKNNNPHACFVIGKDIRGQIIIYENSYPLGMYILSFNTKKLRDAFLENNRELLETAKPLL